MKKRLACDAIKVSFRVMEDLTLPRIKKPNSVWACFIPKTADVHDTNPSESCDEGFMAKQEECVLDVYDDLEYGRLPFSDGRSSGGWEDFTKDNRNGVEDVSTKGAKSTCKEKHSRSWTHVLRVRPLQQAKKPKKKGFLEKYIGAREMDKETKEILVKKMKTRKFQEVVRNLNFLKASWKDYAFAMFHNYALEVKEEESKKTICEGAQ